MVIFLQAFAVLLRVQERWRNAETMRRMEIASASLVTTEPVDQSSAKQTAKTTSARMMASVNKGQMEGFVCAKLGSQVTNVSKRARRLLSSLSSAWLLHWSFWDSLRCLFGTRKLNLTVWTKASIWITNQARIAHPLTRWKRTLTQAWTSAMKNCTEKSMVALRLLLFHSLTAYQKM